MSTRLLLATGNPGKVRELRALLRGRPFAPCALSDLDAEPAMPEETGATYRENARLKALSLARATGWLTLADDSGLEVACLAGRPGVRSARYAPTADERIERLWAELRGRLPAEARFVCVVALARPDGRCRSFRGECRGAIVAERRGRAGFGYDPVFLVRGRTETMAELPEGEKDRLSHRARAVGALLRWLDSPRGRLSGLLGPC